MRTMRVRSLTLLLVLISGCDRWNSLWGPVGPHDTRTPPHVLVQYEGEPVPSRDYDGERIMSGHIRLNPDGTYQDVLSRYVHTVGIVKDSFAGTWVLSSDTLRFTAPQYNITYSAHVVDQEFTLRWSDGTGVKRSFTYRR